MAALTKQLARRLLQRKMRDRLILTPSADGAAGGGSFFASAVSGKDPEFYQGQFAIVTFADTTVKWAQISHFANTDEGQAADEFALVPAVGAVVTTACTVEIVAYNPELYTDALNEGLRRAYVRKHIYQPLVDVNGDPVTITLTNAWEYDLPTGVTSSMITRLMTNGFGELENRPQDEWGPDVVGFSPDGLSLWWGRGNDPNRLMTPIAGRTLYLLGYMPLTPFPSDDTPFTIADDVAETELDDASPVVELLLLYARSEFFNLLAADDRDPKWGQLAEQYAAEVVREGPRLRMPSPDRNFDGS